MLNKNVHIHKTAKSAQTQESQKSQNYNILSS